MLTLLAAGLASGQQTIRAMAQWVHLHADTLCAALPTLTTLPSESTLLRTARQIDVGIRETAIAQRTQPHTNAEEAAGQVVTPGGTILQAQAVDGKTLRGTTACGHPTHLVSLVQHGSGTTLAHDHVAQKRTEITAVPHVLAGRDLTDTVVTMDARLTQRTRAQQSIDQGGHYLMMVQRNQPQLHDDTTGDCAALGWPGATQLLRRTGERTVQKTGTCTVTVTDGITSVPPAEADAKLRERLWREHWTIESRSHYVRDVTFGRRPQPYAHGSVAADIGGVAEWSARRVAAGRVDEHRGCGAGTCGVGATRAGVHRCSGDVDVALRCREWLSWLVVAAGVSRETARVRNAMVRCRNAARLCVPARKWLLQCRTPRALL